MIAQPQNPLPDLIGRLLREPLVLLLLLSWVGGLVTKVLQAKKKRDAARPRLDQELEEQAARPSRGRRTPEEVAAEMRRLLGMDPAPARPVPAAPKPPAVAPVSRRIVREENREGDRGSEPMRVSQLGKVATHVDPHVGEGVQRRAAPMSGGVAAHELGTLGGRSHAATVSRAQTARRLLDLSDLSRAFVLREVLDAPRALRGWDS